MAAPGLCGPRRAPRPLRGGGPALAVAVVGLALGGLGGRSPPTALLRASAVAVAAVPPPGPPCPPPTAPAAAASRNIPTQQFPLKALRPWHGGLHPPPPFSIRSAPSTAHVPSKTTLVPSLAWLLESVGVAALASAPGAHSILLWLGLVLLLLGLWILSPALQLRGVGAGGLWANSGGSTRSTTPVWCSLATAAPQGSANPEHSPTTSPPLVDIGPDSDVPLRMPSADVQRYLDAFAIDVRKVVRRCPAVAKYNVERVERITSYLAGLKVDVRRVVEACPKSLTGQVERYEAVVELLWANGVDVVNAINRCPSVLSRRLDTLRHTMAAIAACGHSVADVVDRRPAMLRCTPSDVAAMLQLHRRSAASATPERPASSQPLPSPAGALEAADPRVALLASLGLDTDRLLRRAPNVLAYSLDRLQVSVAYLKGLGVDAPSVVQRAPIVLTLVPETLQRRVQFLAENGLDVVRHINGCPSVLLYSVERKLQPTLTFVVEEMKRTTVELDGAYHLWSYSLEDRLRPRFQYLRSLGLLRPPLASFGIFPDARFASRLAGTDLQHYYAWRLRNGYAVHSLPTDADPSSPEEDSDSDAPLRMPNADVQRHLEAFAIDVRKVVRRCPAVAKYDVERVQRVTSYLAGLKVDVRRAVEAYPQSLGGQVERYEAVVELLRANGVDVLHAIHRNPSVLRCRLDMLRHIMAAIAACGHSVADVVDRQPQILRSSASNVATMLQLHHQSTAATPERPASGQPPPSPAGAPEAADPRVALLASLGLDTDRLLRRAPHILLYSLDKLQDSVAYLKNLGVDTPRVVWRAPTVLAMLPETLQRRVQFLAENGLDVVRLINGNPQMLYFSVEGKLQPTLTFVVEEMKRSTVELDGAYNLWSYSLQDRLRPRFQYLQSLGRSRPPLSSFGSFSDARFASRVAGTDLQHYYAWRLWNGYAVPELPTDAGPSGPEEELQPPTQSTLHFC